MAKAAHVQSCLTMTPLGLQAACPSHLTQYRLIWSASSHVGLANAGQQLSCGGAIKAAVEAHHLPQAAIVEGLKLCPLCLCEGPRLRCTVHEPRQHQGFIELELGAKPHPLGGEQICLEGSEDLPC